MTPVLWLCGPPGVGKTTVGWRIFNDLADAGIRTGYVDIDQLGICYPEPPDDPDRHHLQARNLDAVVETFAEAGARCVVVSGVVDPYAGPHSGEIPHADLTVVRLRVAHDELKARFLGRAMSGDLLDDALREADAYDRADFGACVDTSGRPVDDVVRLVRSAIGDWPRATSPVAPAPITARHAAGTVTWLCGATGVGKSTVGWQMWMENVRAGAVAGFVDLAQIGFLRPAPDGDPSRHHVKARNLAAVWQAFRSYRAGSLVVVGSVEDLAGISVYREALAGAAVTVVRLDADRAVLTERISARGRGGGPALAGDALVGRSETELLRVAEVATADAVAMRKAGLGDLSVDTDGSSPAEITAEIRRLTGLAI